ncbi:MAG: hypothetical protein RLY14_320 [Planctomycetota bacterium]
METNLSPTWITIYSVVVILFTIAMYLVGWAAEKRIESVDDYLVAGRKLPLPLSIATLVATWFGAEVLLQTSDEVYQGGLRFGIMDPLGTGFCLILAGWLVAKPMWKMHLTTVPDFFYRKFGRATEIVAAVILVPSYLGWVATQFVGLAQLLEIIFGIPITWGIILVAVLGTGYTVLGGMWSVAWTDAIQLAFICVGLIILGYEAAIYLGDGSATAGLSRIWNESPEKSWEIVSPDHFAEDILHACGALAIGALGNIPVQDLMQRMFAAKSASVARHACWWSGVIYILMASVPLTVAIAANLILTEPVESGVITIMAVKLLNPILLLLFVLAVISAVLSTMDSATMAAASILGQNLILHIPTVKHWKLHDKTVLRLQRVCVILIAGLALATAFSGRGTYELLRDAYSMTLVGLFVPLMAGLYWKEVTQRAALMGMLCGSICWFLHWLVDWDYALQGWLEPILPISFSWLAQIPQELLSTFASLLGTVLAAEKWKFTLERH